MTGTFSILTRPANSLLKKIHNSGENGNRMPLILSKEWADQWLKKDLTETELKAITAYEFPAAQMNAWPVNPIRIRKENNENIIKEISAEAIPAL